MSIQSKKQPVLFVGHGSPMETLSESVFVRTWSQVGIWLSDTFERPKAILVISAHWYSNELLVSNSPGNKTIYDFGGFPPELSQVKYPAPGYPEIVDILNQLPQKLNVKGQPYGLDHGSWTVLRHIFPKADVPVAQLSIPMSWNFKQHLEVGQALQALRDQGILIIGSGNVVHNLAKADWRGNGPEKYDWAVSFDDFIYQSLVAKPDATWPQQLVLRSDAELATAGWDHFIPLLYCYGAASPNETALAFNQTVMMGSLSMTSYIWSEVLPKL